jgi:hypothetical protein
MTNDDVQVVREVVARLCKSLEGVAEAVSTQTNVLRDIRDLLHEVQLDPRIAEHLHTIAAEITYMTDHWPTSL